MIFLIDPPWPKKKGGIRKVNPNQGRHLDYSTMSVSAIFDLLDNDIFPTCQHTVFLWCIDQFLIDAEHEMMRRGYRRHARLIWNKLNGVAPGFSVRYTHEYLIWYYKPKFMQVHKSQRGKFPTVFEEKSRQHSRKPDFAYQMIESMFPDEQKMDVFSREHRPGWGQYGNEPSYFDDGSHES